MAATSPSFGRRRTVQLLAVGLAGLVVPAGCSNGQLGGGGGSGSKAPSIPDNPTGDLNVVVSSASGSDAGFKAVNKAFAAKYPDVKINFTSIPNENYPAAHSARLTAGSIDVGLAGPKELPDYVPASNEGDDARLAKAGGYVDLTDQPFMKNYIPTVLDQIRFEGKNYTVPTGLSYYSGMFYNKAIFAQHDITIPTTWDDFLAVRDQLKGKGVVPLGIGGKDSAGLNMLAVVQNLYPTAQDKADLAKGLWDQSVKLNEGKPLEVLQKTQTLYGHAEPNFAGVSYSTMTADFVHGKFAMMSDGTWNETTIEEAGGSGFEFGYFPLPSSDSAEDNKFLGGKVELTLAIPSNGKNVPGALAWVNFFSQPENYKLFLTEAGFAPSQPDADASSFYSSIKDYTSTFQPAWDAIWVENTKAGPAAALPFNWAGIKPMGKADAKGAADAAEKDWEAGF